jgi:hypothetical protein
MKEQPYVWRVGDVFTDGTYRVGRGFDSRREGGPALVWLVMGDDDPADLQRVERGRTLAVRGRAPGGPARPMRRKARLDVWSRVFEDAVAYRFLWGQSVARIRRIYRVRQIEVEQVLRRHATRRHGR